MSRLSRFYQMLAVLVIATSTPGVGELLEGAVHMALESAGAISHEDLGHCGESVGHDEDGHCGDSCPDGGCTRGFFHSCRADAPVVASTIAPHLMGASSDGRAVFAAFGSAGRVLSGFAPAPFRPPCA